MEALTALFRALFNSARDLLPIVIVITFFQLVVLQEPLPNLVSILFGLLLVILGLTFFYFRARTRLVPHWRKYGTSLCSKGQCVLVIDFCVLLGVWNHYRRASIDCCCRRGLRGGG